ncbi:BTB/POZ and MATH domain-containing protein 2 [Dichanthelium oligosanthes]|uniref:BTB/POZ and MATH domain-containing protein 2 n=1 Tax=Dichanthelium oligosanthes TaxID=888268 RepID=A0A1E5UTT6_9POAL|nr:BTB/POZ and MATH domain-containing protein 2 [Dichanthelium oligosanthes]
MGRDGTPSDSDACRIVHVYPPEDSPSWGFPQFVKRRDLKSLYVSNGWVTIVCCVIVMCNDSTPVPPPSDIGLHLGRLLDRAMAADVRFMVDDATMPLITVQDIDPAAFRVMLQFVYTDSFPADKELGDSPTDMLQHLIAAADRYTLDRLKIMCPQKLREEVSVDTVGSILACAEAYNCSELKQKCLDFFAVEKNFKKAAFTDGFVTLVQKFPSLATELRLRVVI